MNEEIQSQAGTNRFEVDTLRDFVIEETPDDNIADEVQKVPGIRGLPPHLAKANGDARFKGWL